MADWKYVMWEANGAMVPILFPNTLIHAEVARYAGGAVRQHVIATRPNNWSSSVVSAGFVSSLLVTGVHGESETLGIKSREEDRGFINTWPYTHGMEDVMGMEPMMFEAFRRALK